MKPFGIISDTHCHAWHAFSQVDADGVNSRLGLILDEFERCAAKVHEAGGHAVFHNGDLFHVRGKVAPSVFLPTRKRMQVCSAKYGTHWQLIPGNHDLEGKDATQNGIANDMLSSGDIHVSFRTRELNDVDGNAFILIPWHDSLDTLRAEITHMAAECAKVRDTYLMIHAPIDGVIAGIPNHGLTATWLAQFGFRAVFSGHYHHAVAFPNEVYSVGAIAQHTWGDVGKKAGFWLVDEAGPRWYESSAPKFIDVEPTWTADQLIENVKGNYARAKVTTTKNADIEGLRDLITKAGAVGVTIQVIREATQTRAATATVKAGASIEESVTDFIKSQTFAGIDPALVAKECQLILAQASIKE